MTGGASSSSLTSPGPYSLVTSSSGSFGAPGLTSSSIAVHSGGAGGSAGAFESRSSSQFVSYPSEEMTSYSIGPVHLSGGVSSSVMTSGGGVSSSGMQVGGGSSKFASSSTTSAMKSATYSPVTQRKASVTLRSGAYEGSYTIRCLIILFRF